MLDGQSTSEIPSCSVMVMSCDAYRDLWTPFFTLFQRFWPDCPFRLFLGSNHAVHSGSNITTLAAGDCAWSDVLRSGLSQIESSYILLLLEDYFVNLPVITGAVIENLRTLQLLGGTVLRLFPRPGPDTPLAEHPGIGCLDPGAPYRVSTQAALWDRTALLNLLRHNESVWDFEWNGTARARTQLDGFYSRYQAVVSYRQVVERGQWFRSAAKYYAGQNIGCDFAARSVMSPAIAFKKTINRFRKNSIRSIARLGASLL